jgi:hypothetical protein
MTEIPMKRLATILVVMTFGLAGCGSTAIQTVTVHKAVKTSETLPEKTYCQQAFHTSCVARRQALVGIDKEINKHNKEQSEEVNQINQEAKKGPPSENQKLTPGQKTCQEEYEKQSQGKMCQPQCQC